MYKVKISGFSLVSLLNEDKKSYIMTVVSAVRTDCADMGVGKERREGYVIH